MNQEIKKKWVEALRSGEYIQGVGALKTDNGYCCLGVLCDLFSKDMGTIEFIRVNPSSDPDVSVYAFNDNRNFPPDEVNKWADFKDINDDHALPIYSYFMLNDKYTSLAALNDNEGFSFKKIADIIEEKF